MDQDRKAKIKMVMNKYLSLRGWPNCPNPDEVIMNNLNGIFSALYAEGLVKKEEYHLFILAADSQYIKAKGRE